MKLPKHFQVGSWVVMNRLRYQIMAYNGRKVILMPVDRSGYIEVVTPYYTR